MCGIAGFLTNGAPPDRSALRQMCDRLAHRGPDASGYYCDEVAALGHRRLSIIDLTTGDQPLGNEDGSLQIVFNGEIYNFQDLRRDLVRKGHRFSTRSDTEVILHLYEEVGERAPEHLNGMFAFAIWDRPRRTLFLARDRFGKKPLYYSQSVAGFDICFASELKAIAGLPHFDRRMNHPAIADFLALGYIPDPQTIFAGVRKLLPGHSLTVSAGGERIRKYWEPAFTVDNPPRFEEAAEHTRKLAADAVACRMISDVPLGAFLSGGVDSSAVVGFMAGQSSTPVKTFSIGFTTRQFDERAFARSIVARYETDHHEEIVTPSVHQILDKLVAHYDEPFGDASAIPTLYLSRMTRQHVTVALSGDGADEVFGGYRRYYWGVVEDQIRAKLPGWFRRSVVSGAARVYPKFDYLPQIFRAKTLLTNLAFDIGDAYFTSMSIFRDANLSAALSDELKRALNGYSPRDAYRKRFEAVRHLSPLQQMQAIDYQTYLPGDILVKADRATMAYSLESRSPWLDYRLAEFAGGLPETFKIRGTDRKKVFKTAVLPLVPPAILTRPKMGFAVPLSAWFCSSLKPMFQDLVLRSEAMACYFNLAELDRVWKEHQSGLRDHSRKLWLLLIFALWEQVHGAGEGQPDCLSFARQPN